MKHNRGIERRTWTFETAVNHLKGVASGLLPSGLTAQSALDYLRPLWADETECWSAQIREANKAKGGFGE